jgi:FixJ family two-component response regulator
MPVVLVTGYADLTPSGNAPRPNFHMIVRKPFTRETLRAALSDVRQQMLAAA